MGILLENHQILCPNNLSPNIVYIMSTIVYIMSTEVSECDFNFLDS